MATLDRVKLKSNQLLVRELVLQAHLNNNMNDISRYQSILTFVIAPLCMGFAVERLSGFIPGVQIMRGIFPLLSLLPKV